MKEIFNNVFVKYGVLFILFFIIIYFVYYFLAIRGQKIMIIGSKKKKKKQESKKKRNILPEIVLLQKYYGIDVEKIGMLRLLKIINVVNALLLDFLVIITLPFNKTWIKLLILVVLMIPSVWATYYFLSRYLKHIEKKGDKNV